MASPSSTRARWVKQAIAAGGPFHAMKATPWKHNLINITAALFVVGVFVATIGLGATMPWWLYLPVASVLMGVVFFSVFVLIVHECSHDMFILSRDRKLQKRINRAIGIVSAAPFFTDYLVHWEKGHTIHHLRPCEPDDPQDRNPLTGAELYKRYAMLLIPGATMALNPSRQYGFKPLRILVGIAMWVPVWAAMYAVAGWLPIVAWVLAMNVVMMLNMTKKAQEHGAGLAHEPDPTLRSRTYFYALDFLFSPFNINYHFEHHANFNVPWYRLPAYHQALQSIVPEPLKPYYFHHDFWAQLNGTKPLPPDELRPLMAG